MATTVSQDPDCYRWNNAPNLLCYECDSCKVGVLENIKRDWHKLSVLNMLSSLEYIPLDAVLSKTQKELKPVTPMARTGCLQSDPDGITTGFVAVVNHKVGGSNPPSSANVPVWFRGEPRITVRAVIFPVNYKQRPKGRLGLPAFDPPMPKSATCKNVDKVGVSEE